MSDERRRFFRIDDEVAIRVHILDDEHDAGDTHPEFQLSLEVQIRQAMVGVRAQYPKLAPLLDLMNQNINVLRANDPPDENALILRKANLSACGVAVTWGEKLRIDERLMVYMYLQPHYDLVRSCAHVTAIDVNPDFPEASDEQYIVRLDFDDIENSYQEVLIQHIVQRQSYQLRQKMDSEN